MSVEKAALRDVRQIYGSRSKGGGVGQMQTAGIERELAVDLSVDYLEGDDVYFGQVVPAGSVITSAYATVTEAFVGTGCIVDVGTKTTESTNGVTVAEIELEAVGSYDLTAALAGTWAAGEALAADTEVGVALTGTFSSKVGAGRVVVTYKKLV